MSKYFFQSCIQSGCFRRGEISWATPKRITFDFKGNQNYHRKGKGNSICDWEKFERSWERESIQRSKFTCIKIQDWYLEHKLDVDISSVLEICHENRMIEMVSIYSHYHVNTELCRWSRRTRPRRWRLTGSSRRWWLTGCAWSCTRCSPS